MGRLCSCRNVQLFNKCNHLLEIILLIHWLNKWEVIIVQHDLKTQKSEICCTMTEHSRSTPCRKPLLPCCLSCISQGDLKHTPVSTTSKHSSPELHSNMLRANEKLALQQCSVCRWATTGLFLSVLLFSETSLWRNHNTERNRNLHNLRSIISNQSFLT